MAAAAGVRRSRWDQARVPYVAATEYPQPDPRQALSKLGRLRVATAAFMIPLDASLRGAVVYAQALAQDPLGSFFGLTLSAGLRLGLGD